MLSLKEMGEGRWSAQQAYIQHSFSSDGNTPHSRPSDPILPSCSRPLPYWEQTDTVTCDSLSPRTISSDIKKQTHTHEYPLQLTLWSCIRAVVTRTGSVSVVGGASAAAHVCSACLNSTPRSLQGKVNTSKWPIAIYKVSMQHVCCV